MLSDAASLSAEAAMGRGSRTLPSAASLAHRLVYLTPGSQDCSVWYKINTKRMTGALFVSFYVTPEDAAFLGSYAKLA